MNQVTMGNQKRSVPAATARCSSQTFDDCETMIFTQSHHRLLRLGTTVVELQKIVLAKHGYQYYQSHRTTTYVTPLTPASTTVRFLYIYYDYHYHRYDYYDYYYCYYCYYYYCFIIIMRQVIDCTEYHCLGFPTSPQIMQQMESFPPPIQKP